MQDRKSNTPKNPAKEREVMQLRAALAKAEAELQQHRTQLHSLPPQVVSELAELLRIHGRDCMVRDLTEVRRMAIRLGGYEGLTAEEANSLYFVEELATMLATEATPEPHLQN